MELTRAAIIKWFKEERDRLEARELELQTVAAEAKVEANAAIDKHKEAVNARADADEIIRLLEESDR